MEGFVFFLSNCTNNGRSLVNFGKFGMAFVQKPGNRQHQFTPIHHVNYKNYK